MNSIQLVQKIELLPEVFQTQVSDFVEFLLNKHFHGNPVPSAEEGLSMEQKSELDRRYQEYLTNPESCVSMESLKSRLMKKYGLQSAS